MPERITNARLTATFIRQINEHRQQMALLQGQISSGFKVSLPGDDPARAGTISQFQNTLQRLGRHKERIDIGLGTLGNQENGLLNSQDLMIRARELAEQGANETLGTAERAILAVEVFNIRDSMVEIANSKYLGRYIWHGANDNTPPFIQSSTPYTNPPTGTNDAAKTRYVFDTQDGATIQRNLVVSDNSSVRISTSGKDIFENAIFALERLGRSLAGYKSAPAPPAAPDGSGAAYTAAEYSVQSADIRATIDLLTNAQQNDMMQEITDLGGRTARIEQEQQILDSLLASTQQSKSTLQDSDIFETASSLQSLQLGLQATLASGTRLQSLTLLNFI